MTHHNQLTRAFELKSCDAQSGTFTGYASVFGVMDSQHDIVHPGAFNRSIKRGTRHIKLLWQHAMDEPIGVIEMLKEDTQGLYIKGRLLMDVARAREAYSLLKNGVVTGLSIGYTPTTARHDPDSGVRHITQIELFEVSLVTFPANDAAQITVVKSAEATTTQDSQREALERTIARCHHILLSP